MTNDNKTDDKTVDIQQQVTDFLKQNPDFFQKNPDVLEAIQLPHQSGSAVSLVERQVNLLRERNIEMRTRLNNMFETARDNDRLFEKTKQLVLHLLEAQDLQSAVDTLFRTLGEDYQIEHYSLLLIGDKQQLPPSRAKVVSSKQANSQIGTLLKSNRAICGTLRQDELSFLFGEQAFQIGSVAVVPLAGTSTFGVLAIGNSDPQYYRSSMGTLFLSYIAEVLNRILPRFL